MTFDFATLGPSLGNIPERRVSVIAGRPGEGDVVWLQQRARHVGARRRGGRGAVGGAEDQRPRRGSPAQPRLCTHAEQVVALRS